MSEYGVSLVPREGLTPEMWGLVGDHLKRAAETTHGRYSIEGIINDVMVNGHNLWIIFDMETQEIVSAFTNQVVSYPKMRVLACHFIGGDHLLEWKDRVLETLDNFARDNFCQKIEFTGRKGWQRLLADWDYEPAFIVYEREIPLIAAKAEDAA
jgi:hypothetical protein